MSVFLVPGLTAYVEAIGSEDVTQLHERVLEPARLRTRRVRRPPRARLQRRVAVLRRRLARAEVLPKRRREVRGPKHVRRVDEHCASSQRRRDGGGEGDVRTEINVLVQRLADRAHLRARESRDVIPSRQRATHALAEDRRTLCVSCGAVSAP
jgi:type II secretory pathway component PulJ